MQNTSSGPHSFLSIHRKEVWEICRLSRQNTNPSQRGLSELSVGNTTLLAVQRKELKWVKSEYLHLLLGEGMRAAPCGSILCNVIWQKHNRKWSASFRDLRGRECPITEKYSSRENIISSLTNVSRSFLNFMDIWAK